MLECRNVIKAIMAGVFAVSLGLAAAAEPKISNLAEYVAKDPAYKGKTALEKLTIIAGYAQKNRLNYNDVSQEPLITKLVQAYMTEKGKKDPTARLEAFAELKAMNKWGKPLNQLRLDDRCCTVEFVQKLNSDKAYQKGDLQKKVDILTDLKKKQMWSTPFGQSEAEKVGVAYITKKTAGLSGKAKALKSLEILSSLKAAELIPWGNTYSGMERLYLHEYLNANVEYQKMSSDEKMAHLRELESKKLIMSFIQSDFESDIVAKKLLADKAFMAKDANAKGEYIDSLGKERKIHSFSAGKIRQLLFLPRK